MDDFVTVKHGDGHLSIRKSDIVWMRRVWSDEKLTLTIKMRDDPDHLTVEFTHDAQIADFINNVLGLKE